MRHTADRLRTQHLHVAPVLAIAVAALLSLSAGCATPQEPAAGTGAAARSAAVEQELLAADAAFASATATRGLEGFMAWFAEDAVRLEIDGFLARGRDAIRAHDASLFEDGTQSLQWEPTDVGADPDGRHGWTRGRYTLLRRTPAGAAEQQSTGHYLTIWRRDASGWKVVLDTGVAERPAAQ